MLVQVAGDPCCITGHPYGDNVAFDPSTSMVCVSKGDVMRIEKFFLQCLPSACPSSIDQLVPPNLSLQINEFSVVLGVPGAFRHWRVVQPCLDPLEKDLCKQWI